jgi:hypothetical protein
MSETNNKIEEGIDWVKDQTPSRQRYYFMIGGFVLGVLVGVLI